MSIENLIKEPESTRLEFKENIKPEDKIIATIIAFANGAGGKIVIGVNDKTRYITGLSDPHKHNEFLSKKIYDIIEPRVLPNIEIIPYRNTYLMIIEVYPSLSRPHFKKSKGKEKSTYIRLGSTTRLADNELLKAIERSVIPKHFDEELCYEMNCEEIDFIAASQLLTHKLKVTINNLVSLGVISKNGSDLIPTFGGILLFGKNRLTHFPDAYLQVGVFEGQNKDKILDTQDITSFLPNAVDEALNFLKKNIKVGLKIEGTRHQELWEIPQIALREALINAVVHTDYSLSGVPIRVAIFNDRIEIENTALLLWGLTFEDLKAGISKLRNPVIARVFHELGLIEKWGSGITRMINACLEAGLAIPLFEAINTRIRITFYKKKISEPVIIEEFDQFIIGVLLLWGEASTNQVAISLGKSRRSVIQRLSRLKDRGKIVEISQGLNDPKKKYALKEGKRALNNNIITKLDFDNRCIEEMKWVSSHNKYTTYSKLYVCFKFGKYCVQLIFSEEDIDDFFHYCEDKKLSEDWKENAKEIVKNTILSKPIFSVILLKHLATEEVQESLLKKVIHNIPISHEDWGSINYRQR